MDDILISDFQQTIAALQEKNATLRAEVARLREALEKIKLESEYSIAYGRSDALYVNTKSESDRLKKIDEIATAALNQLESEE